MSYQPLWLRDLVAYSIQAAVLVGVGVVVARVLRLRVPRVRHAYWQALLAVCVLLPLLQPWRPEVLEPSGAALSNITFGAPAAAAPAGPPLAQIVLWLICAGIVLRLGWMALGLGRLWLYRRRAEQIEQAPKAIEEAQRLAPVSVALFISRQLPTPATFGFFRPAILFPARFLEMEPTMQKAVALHELLHVQRHDWLWNMFEELVLTALWFHFPLWWVVRSARLSREQVVDAEAVRRSNARRPYLKALLEMAGQKRLAESLPAPLFLRESQLAERVALMMKEVQMSRTRLTVSLLTAAVTILIAGTTIVWAFPLKTSAPQTEASAVASAPVPAVASKAAWAGLSGGAIAQQAGSTQGAMKIYEVGGTVIAPQPISNPDPPYTRQARKNHLTGTVVFSVVVNAQGRVAEVKQVSKPLGQGLDESAISTIRSWKFKPGTRNGIPVPVRVEVEITFKLYGNSADASPNPGPRAKSITDPPAQTSPNASLRADENRKEYINQKEIQRQLHKAMKQAKIAQEAASKIDQKKIQEQIERAMKQAKIAQENLAKIDQAKIQHQVQEAMKQAEKMNTPEMRRQMEEAMKQLQKMNTPEMQEQLRHAMEQAKIAQEAAARVNKAEIQREVEQAKKEVDASRLRAEAEKARKDAEAARTEAKDARKDAAAARKEVEKLREQQKKERLELQKQRKEARPLPPSPVLPAPPAPPPSGKVASPPAPPASPAPPPVLPSTGKVSVPPAPPASPAPPPSTNNVPPPAPPASPAPPPVPQN